MGNVLTAEEISKEFTRVSKGTNRFTALQKTTVALESGRLVVLTGRSGRGKSTLLNILSGLIAPSTGRVSLGGESDVYALPDSRLSKLRAEHIGVIPQGQTAIHSLTVEENILLPSTLFGDKPDAAFAGELMERLGISQLAGVLPAELSGGELRRMAIARAAVRRPEIILADEPTGDLDDENTAIVFAFLRELAADGSAVLVVTHEPSASDYADSVWSMSSGVLSM